MDSDTREVLKDILKLMEILMGNINELDKKVSKAEKGTANNWADIVDIKKKLDEIMN